MNEQHRAVSARLNLLHYFSLLVVWLPKPADFCALQHVRSNTTDFQNPHNVAFRMELPDFNLGSRDSAPKKKLNQSQDDLPKSTVLFCFAFTFRVLAWSREKREAYQHSSYLPLNLGKTVSTVECSMGRKQNYNRNGTEWKKTRLYS